MHKMQFNFRPIFAAAVVTFVTSFSLCPMPAGLLAPAEPLLAPSLRWLRSGAGGGARHRQSSAGGTASISLLQSSVCSSVLKDSWFGFGFDPFRQQLWLWV